MILPLQDTTHSCADTNSVTVLFLWALVAGAWKESFKSLSQEISAAASLKCFHSHTVTWALEQKPWELLNNLQVLLDQKAEDVILKKQITYPYIWKDCIGTSNPLLLATEPDELTFYHEKKQDR